jgi:hypothetical protein
LQPGQSDDRVAVVNADGTPDVRITHRLAELREELRRGTEEMATLDARRRELHALLLRIGGAAQVLQELLDDAGVARNGTDTLGGASVRHAEMP